MMSFIENQHVSRFILGAVIFLCIVIFSELSLSDQIDQSRELEQFYFYVNFVLLSFFMAEISAKLFAYGHSFLLEFINVFDSLVVVTSYVMLLLNMKAKILGILRVLRLIKVIIEMKKVAD